MISIRQQPDFPQAAVRKRSGHDATLVYAAAVSLLAILALAAYLTLVGSMTVQREFATAAGLTERQATLSQRIASLSAQYALGDAGVRNDLRAATNAFETTHRELVAGDPKTGLKPAAADASLEAVYIARARQVGALPTRDPALAAQAALLFAPARRPLLDALAAALIMRQQQADRQVSFLHALGATLCALVFATLAAITLAIYRPMARRIGALLREVNALTHIATTDPLTGMLNERSFQARGAIEIQKARRYHRPLSMLMIDADQLDVVERDFGHSGGETVLKALTSSFCDGTRVSDLIARVDSEQFAILLPETNSAGAELLAERLRIKVGDLSLRIDDKRVPCTISVGVAVAEKDASFLWPTFKRADEALWEAKMRGRNQVFVAAAASP